MRSLAVRLQALVAILITAGVSAFASAATIRVDDSSPTNGLGNLPDFSNAFNNLQDALAEAYSNEDDEDEILVAQGVYRPDLTSPHDNFAFFELRGGITLLGGFAGVGAPNPAARNIDVYVTILSADNADDDDEEEYDDNSYNIIRCEDVNSSVNPTFVEGFTFTGVHSGEENSSAFFNVESASPRIERCTFIDNHSQGGCGILNHTESGPLIVRCTFKNNSADVNGAAIWCRFDSTATIFNCQFIGNRCEHVGGAIAFQPDTDTALTAIVANCLFVGNSAFDSGGAIRIAQGLEVYVRDCTFTQNTAGPSTANQDWTKGGGAVSVGSATSQNRTANISNCIFWDNHLKFSQEPNPPPLIGPEISIDGLTAGYVNISFCDIKGGLSGVGVQFSPAGDYLQWLDGNINANPMFETDASVGVDGEWGTPDDVGNLRLAYSSPCLNNGDAGLLPADSADLDNDSGTTVLPLDLDDEDRQVYLPAAGCLDMGAYENQTQGTCYADITGTGGLPDGNINIDDLLLVISRWDSPGGIADIAPALDCGDAAVNIDDLLGIIGSWGTCSNPAGVPQTISGCLTVCSTAATSEDYINCLSKCLPAVE